VTCFGAPLSCDTPITAQTCLYYPSVCYLLADLSNVRFLFEKGYKYFVEAGRVAFINFGDDYGKMVTIVDVADENRVLVDAEDFPRMIMPLKRLSLTRMKIPLERGSRTGTLIKSAKKAGLAAKWADTPIAKKLAKRALRANLTDIQRFQVMINRKQRSLAIKKKVKAITKKPAGKAAAKGGKKK